MLKRWTACTAFVLMFAGCGFFAVTANAEPINPQWQDRGGWDAPPQELQEIQRMGFHDGVSAARQDFAYHLQPSPENHEEFRHPHMPPEQREAYRDGFRMGYQRGIDNLFRQAPPPPVAPEHHYEHHFDGAFFEVRHHGFQDGMEAALLDLGNHRRPDPESRNEFRSPGVASELAEAYREGFRRGYNAMAQTLTDTGNDWQFGSFGEVHMRGFHEGALGALHDFDGHRNADPNNHDEYRSPHVGFLYIGAYRDGFRLGYKRVSDELYNYLGR